MQRELIIGITGVKGSGKSTVATMLADALPDVEIVAWADALKDEVATLIQNATGKRPSREEMEGLKSEVYGPLFQGWGAYRRTQNPQYWVRAWNYRAPIRVIVPDCRHHNEVDYVKAYRGYLINIVGPSRWEGDTRSSTHESERFVGELAARADYHIVNDGSLADLREVVTYIAREIAALKAGFDVGRVAA